MGSMLSDPNSSMAKVAATLLYRDPGAHLANMERAQSGALDLAQKQGALQASANLGLTPDPKTGITWNAPAVVPGETPDQTTSRIRGLMNQADPGAALKNFQSLQARQNSMNALNSLDLPPGARAPAQLEAFGLPKTAEALSKNLEQPDQVKLVTSLTNSIASNGGPSAPGAQPFVKMLQNQTQNIDMAKLQEEVRKNMSDEAEKAMEFKQDPTTMQWMLFDKHKGTMTPVGGNAAPAPWMGPSAGLPPPPANLGAPGGAAPSSAPMPAPPGGGTMLPPPPAGGAPAPANQPAQSGQAAPFFMNDFIKGLPQDAQQRFAQIPAAQQPVIAGILSGATPPPPGTGRSPEIMGMMQDQLRKAAYVLPNFNEQLWQARNEQTKDMTNSTPNSAGGQRVAAQTLTGHIWGLLDAAADNNNNNFLGNIGNMADNALVANTGQGTHGNSAAKKAALENFKVHQIGVGEEGTKVMSGQAGTDSAKKDMQDRFTENGDIPSTVGSTGALAEMMQQRIQSQVDKQNSIMGTNMTPADWLGPKAMKQYNAIQQIAEAAKSGQEVTPKSVKMTLRGISQPAAAALIQNPKLRAQFDQKYGAGASSIVLGK